MKTIKYSNLLIIRNLDQLPHGTGAKYLEALIDNEHNGLLAICWRKVKPTFRPQPLDHVLIEF